MANRTIRYLLMLVLLLAAGRIAMAQGGPDWSGLVIEANGFAGKQIKIYPDYPANGLSAFGELNVGYKCYGTKAWHHDWRYPQIGISFLYGYHGNNDVMGSSFALVPNITFESRDSRKLLTDVRLGTGLAWFNRPYDRIGNPGNMVVGSHVTNVTYLSVRLRKILSPSFSIWGGFSFIHYSNGHYQLPNVGLNTPSLDIGLKVYPKGKPVIKADTSGPRAPDRRIRVNIRLGFGVHEFGSMTKPVGGPKYPIWMLTAYASRRVWKSGNLQAGVFLTYYSSYYDYIVSQSYYEKQRRMRAAVLSAFVGYEFIIGHFGLMWQSGVNVYNPFQADYMKMNYGTGTSAKLKTWWCNKVGAQYYVLKPGRDKRFNVWVGVWIKSNLMTADFVETAAGVSF